MVRLQRLDWRSEPAASQNPAPSGLIAGVGSHHHAIATSSAEAQKWVKRAFEEAWKDADAKLTIEAL